MTYLPHQASDSIGSPILSPPPEALSWLESRHLAVAILPTPTRINSDPELALLTPDLDPTAGWLSGAATGSCIQRISAPLSLLPQTRVRDPRVTVATRSQTLLDARSPFCSDEIHLTSAFPLRSFL